MIKKVDHLKLELFSLPPGNGSWRLFCGGGVSTLQWQLWHHLKIRQGPESSHPLSNLCVLEYRWHRHLLHILPCCNAEGDSPPPPSTAGTNRLHLFQQLQCVLFPHVHTHNSVPATVLPLAARSAWTLRGKRLFQSGLLHSVPKQTT